MGVPDLEEAGRFVRGGRVLGIGGEEEFGVLCRHTLALFFVTVGMDIV